MQTTQQIRRAGKKQLRHTRSKRREIRVVDEKRIAFQELQTIPGVGKSIAGDLYSIGIRKVSDLKYRDPEELYVHSNKLAGTKQDRCLFYVFRCAVYFAKQLNRKNRN
jgi:hypothetical protein